MKILTRALFLITGLSLVGVYMLWSAFGTPSFKAEEVAPPTQQSSNHPGHETAPPTSILTTGLEQDFLQLSNSDKAHRLLAAALNAQSATDYLSFLEDLADFRPHYAAMHAKVLITFCSEGHIHAQEVLNAPPGMIKIRRQWCESLDQSGAETLALLAESLPKPKDEVDRMAQHPFLGPAMTIEHALSTAENNEQWSTTFSELVENAETWEELLDLRDWNLTSSGEFNMSPKWDLGADLWKDRYPVANLVNSQNVALQLYMCERFGGCEQTQFIRMNLCSSTAFVGAYCPDGTSIQDVLYMTTPPIDWELAQEILWRLRHRKP